MKRELQIMLNSFTCNRLPSEIIKKIIGISYPLNCSISLEDLRYITVNHFDFKGVKKSGELIVNVNVSQDIIDIFKYLFDFHYPIEKILLIDDYAADDELSMADNNTSCFNYRNIISSDKLSLHSYGLAIDINPLFNPYVRSGQNILPINATDFVDRNKDFIGKIEKYDICYNAFIGKGWKWGGDWINTKDYQHFYKDIIPY